MAHLHVGTVKLGVADHIQLPDDYGILGLSARDDEDDEHGTTHFIQLLKDMDITFFSVFYRKEDGITNTDNGGRIVFGRFMLTFNLVVDFKANTILTIAPMLSAVLPTSMMIRTMKTNIQDGSLPLNQLR
jgi:hypothetical protein